MKYVASLFATLMLFWLMLSGHYTLLITGFGLASCALICWLSLRMRLVDAESQPLHIIRHLPLYWLWLALEIAKSNLAVVKLVLRGRDALEPTLVSVPVEHKSALFQSIFANSITLTPGTVSVTVQNDVIEVHALAREEAEALEGGAMSQRILQLNDRTRKTDASGANS